MVNNKIIECEQQIAQGQESTSRRKLKKAEKTCKSAGYNGTCYTYLKQNGLLYGVSAETLYKIGQHFEGKDGNKAKECFTIAAGKNYGPAKAKME